MNYFLISLLLPFLFVSYALQGKKEDPNAYKAPHAKIMADTAPTGPVRVDISMTR